MVDPAQLVGAREIVERLGLKRVQHVHWYREHDPSFPEALAQIGGGRQYIWYWPDVEEWARKVGRLPPADEDRPPKNR